MTERHGYSAISQQDGTSPSVVPVGATGKLVIQPNGRYSYSYGPSGLAGLFLNRFTLLCGALASVGGLSFGYDQGVGNTSPGFFRLIQIANVLVMPQFIADFGMNELEMGFVTAMLELGALLGALLAGSLADKYSRTQAIFAACLFALAGALFQSLSPTHTLTFLSIGRFIAGIGIGALSSLAPLYISEISPPETRGSLVSLEQLSIVVGVVVGFWTGFFTRNFELSASWRTPLFLQIVPTVILGAGCSILPSSPRLLVLHGKTDEARDSLSVLRREHLDVPSAQSLVSLELLEMEVEAELIHQSLISTHHNKPPESWWEKERAAWAQLFSSKNKERGWIGVLMMVFQQWSGINALLYFGPILVQSVGVGDPTEPHPTSNLIVAGGIGLVQMFAVLPAMLVVDLWGRKPLLKLGSIVMAMSHFLIAILIMSFNNSWSDHPWAAWFAVSAMYVFTAAYGLSFGPIAWILPAEIFSLSTRSKGVALSTASNWTNNFIIGLITPGIMSFSPVFTFVVFGLSCSAAYFWSANVVPETANVSLEDMDELFNTHLDETSENELRRQIERDMGLSDLIEDLGESTRESS